MVLHRNNVRSRRCYSSSWFFALLFQFPGTSVARATRDERSECDRRWKHQSKLDNSGPPFSANNVVVGVSGVHLISIAERHGGAIVCRANYCTRARSTGFIASARDSSVPLCSLVLTDTARISSCKKIIARPSSWPYLNACQYYLVSRAMPHRRRELKGSEN